MKVLLPITILAIVALSCSETKQTEVAKNDLTTQVPISEKKQRTLSEDFKKYWYDGTAEITSYKLSQERYGELREGSVVTIFVTEDFLPKKQVKADRYSENNTSVLKLNTSKNFLTGIYPYSIMTSSFIPVEEIKHPLKITNSIQEWCGQTYMQLNNRNQFEISGHSYFETEGDVDFKLEKTWLEDEFWSLIRINPEELPTGELKVIPGLEYARLRHKTPKALNANASLTQADSLSKYIISYPEIERELRIYFDPTFPFTIEKWEETSASKLNTTATRIKRIKAPYWGLNSNKDLKIRDSLQLPQ